jgi:hypothetical protein
LDAANIVLVVALAATATIAEACEVQLISGVALDGGNAAALITLVFAGPLVALIVLLSPIVLRATVLWRLPQLGVERKTLFRIGNLSNLASYGWSLIIASEVLTFAPRLQLDAPAGRLLLSLAAIVGAGMITSATQFALGPLVYYRLWDGARVALIVRPALMAVPVDLGMVLLGAASIVLYALVGTPALACFALIIVLPRLIPAAAQAPRARELSQPQATAIYASALSAALGLDRETMHRDIPRILNQARLNRETGLLELVEGSRVLSPAFLKGMLADRDPLAYAAITINEHADGSGPAGIYPPLTTRIVAVAEAWAELTAHGGPELTHQQTLTCLRAQGSRFDAVVVASAEAIVERGERPTRMPFRSGSALVVPTAAVGSLA